MPNQNDESDSEYMTEESTSEDNDHDPTYFGFGVHTKPMKQNRLEQLSETDISDITADILEQTQGYIETNMINMSSPSFYDEIKKAVTQTLYESWYSAGLFDEEDDDVYEEIEEFVDQTVDLYFESSALPSRSVRYSPTRALLEEEKHSIEERLAYLTSIDQPKQRTKEWYDFRNGLITASNLWKVFGSEAQRNSLIYEKCKNATVDTKDFCNTESPMHWGVKYEPVTVMIYEAMFQTKISDFGCIQHPVYSCIGASPDGINTDPTNERYGRMLEIKNIKNRDITGIPKEEYWIQTQIQMETCDLDECDFVETRILEYASEEEFYADTAADYKGVILYLLQQEASGVSQPFYSYMPIELGNEKEDVDEWIAATKAESRLEGLVLFSVLYWHLDEISCVLIPRNRAWFQAAVPKIVDIWNTIEKERVSGYEHRSAKKRGSDKIVVTGSDTSTSYTVNNLHLTNSICLVKLDNNN